MDADTVMKGYLAQLNPPPPKPITPVAEEGSAPESVEAAPTPKPEPVKEPVEKSNPKQQATVQPVKVLWISLAIVAMIVVAVALKLMTRYKNETPIVAEQKTEDKSGATLPILPGNQSMPADANGVVAADLPAPMPVPVNPVHNTEEHVAAEEPAAKPEETVAVATPPTPPPAQDVAEQKPATTPPKSTPAVVATPPVEKPTPPVAKAEEKPKEPEKAPAAATPPVATTAGSKRVILEALDKVNIVIKKGSKQYKVTLQPDEIHTVNYSDTIEVEVSDGGAVNVIQNGHDNGVAGDLGKPKKISL